MKINRIFVSLSVFIVLLTPACFEDDLGDIRDNITGTWRCQEESQLFEVQYYDVDISKDESDELQIVIYNFFDRKQDVLAVVSGFSLTIEAQEIDGWLIEGTGEMSTNYEIITWQFTADDGNGPEDFSAYYNIKSPVAIDFLIEN
ncbi:MAG: hypothetical protein KAI79_10890 [Bacteroidales bacterium]|nr:hypothetical protein [Bacteroidales bacterium]